MPAARAALRGREIAYVADPLDALVLQIQGSGRLRITEPDGRDAPRARWPSPATTTSRTARSAAGWSSRASCALEQASWPAIKALGARNPSACNEMLWSNPRVVFFREEPLPDPRVGPRGAQGVPLTPGRSIAVDPLSDPYGTPVWLDTTEPLSTPRRCAALVMAQDTGSAITGARARRLLLGLGRRRRGAGRAHEAAAAHVGAGTAGVKVFAASCDKPAPRHSKAEGAP